MLMPGAPDSGPQPVQETRRCPVGFGLASAAAWSLPLPHSACPCAGVEASKPSVSGADADCPVLQKAPHRTYVGHTADVLDLAWSKSQFLLTASMDKTVRLWHISMEDCLRVFKCGPRPCMESENGRAGV